jgi:hypothetical protein
MARGASAPCLSVQIRERAGARDIQCTAGRMARDERLWSACQYRVWKKPRRPAVVCATQTIWLWAHFAVSHFAIFNGTANAARTFSVIPIMGIDI